jgi:cyanate permease
VRVVELTQEQFLPIDNKLQNAQAIVRPSTTYWQDAWYRLKQNKAAIAGLIIIILLTLMALVGPLFSGYTYDNQVLTRTNEPPGGEHWFGTEQLGRDLYTRVWWGARVSLFVGFATAIIVMVIGVTYERRAMALGLVLGGGAIGGFFLPQVSSAIIKTIGGAWRTGWFIFAGTSVVVGLLSLAFVRNHPSDLDQYADGKEPGEARTTKAKASKVYRTPTNWELRDALKTPAMWLLILAFIGVTFLWELTVAHAPFHLQDQGFDHTRAAFFYSLAIGASIFGRFTIAALGDRVEPRLLFSLGVLSTLLGGITFWFASPVYTWAAYLYPLLLGYGFGSSYVCRSVIIGNYWGPDTFTQISGITTPIGSLISSAAPPLGGFLYDRNGTYFAILIISWILASISLVASVLCTPPQRKEVAQAEAIHSPGTQ